MQKTGGILKSKIVKVKYEVIIMTISDLIEQMLNEMLSSSDGSVEIRRNILADQLNCVPSQINYVIKKEEIKSME